MPIMPRYATEDRPADIPRSMPRTGNGMCLIEFSRLCRSPAIARGLALSLHSRVYGKWTQELGILQFFLPIHSQADPACLPSLGRLQEACGRAVPCRPCAARSLGDSIVRPRCNARSACQEAEMQSRKAEQRTWWLSTSSSRARLLTDAAIRSSRLSTSRNACLELVQARA